MESDDPAEPAAAATPVVVPAGFRVGCWEVGEPIGSGAWGSVYAAHRLGGLPSDVREAALKFLPADTIAPGRMAHLSDVVERELRFATRRDHGLIRTFEILVAEADEEPLRGARVLAMERARTSLRELIADQSDGGQPPRASRMLAELWETLTGLHARGWVHGDVKPANVLILADGSTRLADFGLAVELDGTHAYAPQPASIDFVPPEWWTERVTEHGAHVRPARDLWAFGILAHLTLGGGRFPFDGQTARARALRAQAYARGNESLRLEPDIPAGWRETIAALLDPDEAAREARRDEVGQRIRELQERGDGGPRRPAGPVRRPRRRLRALVAGAVAVLATVVAILVSQGADEAPPSSAGDAGSQAFVGGELRPDAAIPARYRSDIVAAAHQCPAEEVTPALIAGMLQVESGFDPRARSPSTDEYGIAKWTPSVFRQWSVDMDGGGASVFSAADSINAVGDYLCAIRRRVSSARGDRALLLAAAYRVGSSRVRAAGTIPGEVRDYVAEVARYARRYAAPVTP